MHHGRTIHRVICDRPIQRQGQPSVEALERGWQLLRGARPLEGATAQGFVDTLQALAEVVLAWRESLQAPAEAAPQPVLPQGAAIA